eukprot:6492773-Amphidinium_carterae.2
MNLGVLRVRGPCQRYPNSSAALASGLPLKPVSKSWDRGSFSQQGKRWGGISMSDVILDPETKKNKRPNAKVVDHKACVDAEASAGGKLSRVLAAGTAVTAITKPTRRAKARRVRREICQEWALGSITAELNDGKTSSKDVFEPLLKALVRLLVPSRLLSMCKLEQGCRTARV